MSVSLPILFDQIEIAAFLGEGEKGQTPCLDSMIQIFFLHHGEVLGLHNFPAKISFG